MSASQHKVRSRALVVLAACLLAGGWSCGDASLFASTNKPPQAEAGVDRQIAAGDSIQLDGSASFDPDGDPITFAWDLVDGPVWVGITEADSERPTLHIPVAGVYRVRLRVTDVQGATDAAQMIIIGVATSGDGNQAPVADAGADLITIAGTPARLDGTGSRDAESEELSFLWVQIGGSAVPIEQGDQARASVTASEPGTYRFRLLVIDEQGLSHSDVVELVVEAAPDLNQPPEADAGPSLHGFVGDTLMLDGRASRDPDGDSLRWEWAQMSGPETLVILADGAMAQFVAPAAGTYELQLTVDDGTEQDTARVRVTVAERTGQIIVEGTFATGDDQ